ncbi:MAG: DUF3429 family protein [Alphaproteobacteria bacterium]|nr:MAG: DUF3429 family protein [Alphaproteobacteria bacterium]
MSHKSTPIPQAAAALGYLGALPFVLASFALWFVEPDMGARITSVMILASAIVFGFIGGLQLGMSMLNENGASFMQLLIGAGVICLAAFVASAQMTPSVALMVMTVSFSGQLWIDLKGNAASRSPAWYAGLRIPLTLLVVASLVSAILKGFV